jgi:Flp pilus assembly protein TadG
MLRHDQKGAALIEFAIVLPLLLLLIFGMIEFSLLMYNKAMITNASREGARRGIVYRVVYNSDTKEMEYNPLADSQIQAEVTSYLSNHLITFSGAVSTPTTPTHTTTITRPVDSVSKDIMLNVQVGYPYQFLIFPVIASLVTPGGTTMPGTITLSSATQMRME